MDLASTLTFTKDRSTSRQRSYYVRCGTQIIGRVQIILHNRFGTIWAAWDGGTEVCQGTSRTAVANGLLAHHRAAKSAAKAA